MARQPDTYSVIEMMTKLGRDLRLPETDIETIVTRHRRNLDALQKSATAAAGGASSVLSRQQQMLQETMHHVMDLAKDLSTAGNPQDAMTRQAEFARRSFELAVRNASEVGQIVQKSGSESIEILKARIKETMDEIRGGYQKKG